MEEGGSGGGREWRREGVEEGGSGGGRKWRREGVEEGGSRGREGVEEGVEKEMIKGVCVREIKEEKTGGRDRGREDGREGSRKRRQEGGIKEEKTGGRGQELSGCRHTTSFSSSHPLRRTIRLFDQFISTA